MSTTDEFRGELIGEAYAASLIAVLDQLGRLSENDRRSALTSNPALLDDATAAAALAIRTTLAGRKISFIRGTLWADPGELGRGLLRGGIDLLMSAIAVDAWMNSINAVCEIQSRKALFEKQWPRRAQAGYPQTMVKGVEVLPLEVHDQWIHRIAIIAAICVMTFKHGRSGQREYFKKRGDRLTPGERRPEIEAAHREGKSARAIAKQMALSNKRVSEIIKGMVRD